MGKYAQSVIGYSIGSRNKSRHHLRDRDIAPTNVKWLRWLIIGVVGKHIIINRLKGFADIVASLKWLLLHLLIDLIVTANVWLKIIKIGLKQKTIGIGKVVLPKSKAVIIYMRGIRIGERRYSRGTTLLAECAGLTKVVYWLPIISGNERIIPNYC